MRDVFAAASEFSEWVQVGIDVYIPHCKYQVKHHSSPWFSAVCAAAIVHRNFFICTNRINLLNLKKGSDRLVIVAKGYLKLPNLYMLIKQKSITSQKPGFRNFYQIGNSVLNNSKSVLPTPFNGL